MSNLVEHAKRELAFAGNDEAFNESIIKAVAAFSSYGHSGGSASVAIPMLYDLLQFKNLTPLTSDPKEWIDRTKESGYPFWQNARNPEAFSKNGGKTYYLLSEVKDGEPSVFHTPGESEVKKDGEFIVIGLECFANKDASVICYKGENYYLKEGV